MVRIPLSWAISLSLAILWACAEPTLRSTDTKSPAEAAIQAVLVRFEDALNARDARAVAEILHGDLKAMIGRNRRIVTKKTYLEEFATRMADRPVFTFGPPKITIAGKRASVALIMTSGTAKTALMFELIEENGHWLILNWRY